MTRSTRKVPLSSGFGRFSRLMAVAVANLSGISLTTRDIPWTASKLDKSRCQILRWTPSTECSFIKDDFTLYTSLPLCTVLARHNAANILKLPTTPAKVIFFKCEKPCKVKQICLSRQRMRHTHYFRYKNSHFKSSRNDFNCVCFSNWEWEIRISFNSSIFSEFKIKPLLGFFAILVNNNVFPYQTTFHFIKYIFGTKYKNHTES